MNKPIIYQRDNLGNAFITATHRRNSIIIWDGKHVHSISIHAIATYHKHNETRMLTYDSGADGH